MGRRSNNAHIELKRVFEDPNDRRCTVTAWCGETSVSYGNDNSYLFQKHPVGACSKCSKKYWTAYNKEHNVLYTFGDNIAGHIATDNPAYKPFRYYKSAYPVLNATGDIVAYVAINNGWGQTWELHVQKNHYGSLSVELPGYADSFREEIDGRTVFYNYKNFTCKEQVLKDMDKYIENKKTFPMKVIEEMIAESKARRAQELEDQRINEARAEKHREELRAKAQSDRDAMRVRIKELLDNPFLGNYDRDTIFELAKLAGYSQEAINA